MVQILSKDGQKLKKHLWMVDFDTVEFVKG